MANNKSGLLLTVSSLLHTIICIMAGSIGWDIQMLVVTIAGIIAVWFASTKYARPLIPIMAIVLPFYLIYVPFSIYLRSYQTFPIWILGLASVLVSYFVLKYVRSVFGRIVLLSLIPLMGWVFVMPNNFSLVFQKENLAPYQITRTTLVDESGMTVDMARLRGKVVLFDVWSSSCGPCIKKFPVLQKLQDKYRDDSSVKIISLNVPLERDKLAKADRFTKPYSFGKFYFSNESEAEKLSIYAYPLVLIFDKDLTCRFAGDLNFGWNIFFGNVETIIDNLKSEK